MWTAGHGFGITGEECSAEANGGRAHGLLLFVPGPSNDNIGKHSTHKKNIINRKQNLLFISFKTNIFYVPKYNSHSIFFL